MSSLKLWLRAFLIPFLAIMASDYFGRHGWPGEASAENPAVYRAGLIGLLACASGVVSELCRRLLEKRPN